MSTDAVKMEVILHVQASVSMFVCQREVCVRVRLNLLWMERCLSLVYRLFLLGQN